MRFRTIIECSDGKIMAAGDYGVAVLSKDSVVSILDAKRGLANEKSLCLLEYQDACYVGSDGGGITRIDKDNHVSSITKRMAYHRMWFFVWFMIRFRLAFLLSQVMGFVICRQTAK